MEVKIVKLEFTIKKNSNLSKLMKKETLIAMDIPIGSLRSNVFRINQI